jgi:hypothetical protein
LIDTITIEDRSYDDSIAEYLSLGYGTMPQRRRPQKASTLEKSGQKSDNVELYDELEQDQQIHEIERSITRLGRKYHVVSNSLGYILMLAYGVLAGIQFMYPFSLRHHALFQGTVKTASSISLGELSSAASLGMSTMAVGRFLSDHVISSHPATRGFTWKDAMNNSIMLTGIQMLYWMTAFLSLYQGSDERHVAWGLIWWKPTIPIIWFIVSTRMIDSISKLQIELGSMHRLKYRHKKL